MTEDDEISPAPPLLAGAEGRPPPSRQSRGSSPPPHSDAHGSLQRQGTDESNLREGKAGKSGKSGHGFGLKRLSTIMSRRKSSVPPPMPMPQDEHGVPSHDQAHGHLAAPAAGGMGNSDTLSKKSKRNSFMPFRRHNDANKQSFQSIDDSHDSHMSGSVTSGEDHHIEPPSRDDMFGHHQGEHINVSGTNGPPDSILELPEPGDGHDNWYQPQHPRQRQTDAEGFTVRVDTEDEISRVQREAATGNYDDEHAIRIRDQKIEEDENAAQQAMAQMANTLRMQAQQSGLRNHGTIRGRRDARNAGHTASSSSIPPEPPAHAHGRPNLAVNVSHNGSYMGPASPNSPQNNQYSPHPSQLSRPPRTMASLSSDQDSTSLYSTARANRNTVFVHTDLSETGLNASLIECVSSKFVEGKIVSSSVLGEIAFAYNPNSDVRQDAKIRLENFSILEKVVANPVFATPEQTAGEYKLNLNNLMRSIPQVVFKQSVRLDPQQLDAYSPVIFEPVWKLQDFQASVIVNYRLNPSFVSAVLGEGITLTNVRLTVNLDTTPTKEGTPARAVSSITYPSEGARFSARRSAVTWKLPSLEVPAEGEGRLLARFGCATPGPRAGQVNVTFEVASELGARVTGQRLGISLLDEDGEKNEKDPFADEIGDDSSSESAWQAVPTRRILKASKYVVV